MLGPIMDDREPWWIFHSSPPLLKVGDPDHSRGWRLCCFPQIWTLSYFIHCFGLPPKNEKMYQFAFVMLEWLPSKNQVCQVRFWMRSYLSPSMKPTMVITNQALLAALDTGAVSPRLKRTAKPVTKKYLDSHGKRRYAGTSSLKKSQTLSIGVLLFPKVFCKILLSTWLFLLCFVLKWHSFPNWW